MTNVHNLFKNNTILCLVGPSCSGKSTLQADLVKTGDFGKLISTTTRPSRDGEVHGEDYYFVDETTFAELHVDKAFVQSVNFPGGSYGVTVEEMNRAFEEYESLVVVVEPTGVDQYEEAAKKYGFNVISVYVSNSVKVLSERFLSRFAADVLTDNASVEIYSKRLHNLFSNELSWGLVRKYDAYLTRYDEQNRNVVAETVADMVKTRSTGFMNKSVNDEESGVLVSGI